MFEPREEVSAVVREARKMRRKTETLGPRLAATATANVALRREAYRLLMAEANARLRAGRN